VGHLLEAVFASIGRIAVKAIMRDLAEQGNVQDSIAIDGIDADDITPEVAIDRVVTYCAFGFGRFAFSNRASIENVVASAYLDLDSWSLEFTMDTADIHEGGSFTEELHGWATALARKHGINDFYAGLEPADDLDTRLFTGSSRGPLRLLE
jgi:hypothetical protein